MSLIGEMSLGLKDHFCILEMFLVTDVIFDVILSLHVLVKIKEAYAHTGKGGHALHLHCRWE